MSNPNGRKGSRFEKAVVEMLRADGFDMAERRKSEGSADRGDVAGIRNTVLEVKDHGVMQMGVAMAECEKERANAGAKFSAVVFKRRGKGTVDAYAVTTLAQYSQMLRILESGGWLR